MEIGMNDKIRLASNNASSVIEEFLVANPHPTMAQWKQLTLVNPEFASQIAEASLLMSSPIEFVDEDVIDTELFNATKSGMLSSVHANTGPIDEVRSALKKCKGPAARTFARQIGLGERVDLFNQLVSGEVTAPYVLLKRLAKQLDVRLTAMAEVFSSNFNNQQIQSFKADGKPIMDLIPVSWEQAVRSAGVTGDEAKRLLHLEKEMD